MPKVFKVIKPGLYTTVQDSGRFGFQKYGMPVCGAMDYFSLNIGNILVGNDENEAGLEITMSGPVLECISSCNISICGGDISPAVDNKPFPMWYSKPIEKEQILSFGKLKNGTRAYLCISGGIKVNKILNSSSTYITGRLGGFEGGILKKENIIETDKQKEAKSGFGLSKTCIPSYSQNTTVRVILGPDSNAFTDKGIKVFLTSKFKITNNSNRMGYRLEGSKIEHKDKADIISSAVNIGTIQVPKDGQPIVLMSDRQTTGGYTRIANVITVDIPLIAQCMPGYTINFKKVSLEEAQAKLKQQKELFSIVKNFITSR